MAVAERIKEIRLIRGYKQEAVAMDMGTTQQSYCCLERYADNARLETLKRVCNALQTDLCFLLSDIPITEHSVHLFTHNKLSQIFIPALDVKQR